MVVLLTRVSLGQIIRPRLSSTRFMMETNRFTTRQTWIALGFFIPLEPHNWHKILDYHPLALDHTQCKTDDSLELHHFEEGEKVPPVAAVEAP